MFSKKDFMSYFKQVYEIEKKMDLAIDELLVSIQNTEHIEVLKKIKADEIKHMHILEEINVILEEHIN